jgi:hypothetical protein
MKNRLLRSVTLCVAACAGLLAACGGGISLSFGDFDEPNPVDATALVTVTSATLAGQNGVYGGESFGLSVVDKVLDGGGFTCVFSFNNLSNLSRPAGSAGTLSGTISYRENARTLSRLEVSINGGAVYAASYAAGAPEDSRVDRDASRVTFSDKVLASTAALDTTSTLVVSGVLPMRGNRPSGC